jgi:CheY-like chemotaxis protein
MTMNDAGHDISPEEIKSTTPAERVLRILVVDDDEEGAWAIVRALEHLGHHAVCCLHAQQAFDLLGREQFDLLLADYRMPDMTGLDLIALLRHDGNKIPAIMMTGHYATDDRVPMEQLAIHAILHKPLTLPTLARALEEPLVAARD